jgi:anion-transporting  ArsA/GET3 family ATPase
LIFVTGKGGVGKTSIAAALAELAVRDGARVLVCEMDSKGALASALETGPLDFDAREIRPQLWAMAMNTEDALREYLRVFVRVPLLGRIGPLARTFDFLADAAPGVKEILAIGKICYEVKERHYDLVVVDTEATGHIVAQIGAPSVIRELVQVGLVRDQTQWMLDVLNDPHITAVAAVTTPEEMPVVETLELIAALRSRTGVDVAAVIANRVLPASFDRSRFEVFDRLGSAEDLLLAAAGPSVAVVIDAVARAEARRRVGAEHLERLRRDLPGGVEMVYAPELMTRATGRRVVMLLAEALSAELDRGTGP